MLCLQGPCAPLGRMEPTHAFSSGLNMDPDIELPHIPDAGYGAAEDEIQMPEPHESQTRLVVAEEASGAKLHGVIQHQLYNRFMDARLHSRLAQETRPLLLMSYALAVGPNRSSSTTISPIPIKEENPQTTDGDRAQNTTSKGSRNGLYGIIANALSVAMVLNACKALATLSRLGDSQYPWEMGLVYLCWWSMVGLCGVAFSFSGGYQANFYALLQVTSIASCLCLGNRKSNMKQREPKLRHEVQARGVCHRLTCSVCNACHRRCREGNISS